MPAVAAPPVIVTPFAINGARNAIPVPSQVTITPGAASYDTGFPPLTMPAPGTDGIPPDGLDMNGILFAISAHAAWAQVGGAYVYSAAVASAGGYPLGAILRSASDLTKFWYNTTANNTVDPDGAGTGWTAFFPITGSPATGVVTSTLGAGQTDNLAVTGSTGYVEITPNAAGSDLSGLNGGNEGQVIVVSNVTTDTLNLLARTGSSAGNQFRLPTDLTLLQWQSAAFKKSVSLGFWIPL